MVTFLNQAIVRGEVVTNVVFDHFRPDSMNNLVWTNLIAQTNGRNTIIWGTRSHPAGWPTTPPVVKWNPTGLLWGMKGLTALSPCWELEGSSGQVPITALTRRHGYARGHSMGPDGFRTNYLGRKVWFLTTNNILVERKVTREVVRTGRTSRNDYSLLLFDQDLPDSIQPMRVAPESQILHPSPAKFPYSPDAPAAIVQTEQTGRVSASLPGFTVNTWKGGDSGSPNMLPFPGELVFFSGRSSSGASPEMQADMDALCKMEGLDPRKYQLQWKDLSAYPLY